MQRKRLTDNERLIRARTQLFILQSAHQDLEEFARGLRARGASGLPHGSASGDALEREVIRREQLERRVDVERRHLDRYRSEAQRIIGRMDTRRALFCTHRYLYGEEMKQIRMALRGSVSARQMERYKREIEGGRA